MTVEELEEVICDDFACIQEFPLLTFIVDWATENDISKDELARVIEHVRFTRMSMENYFEAVSHPDLEVFLRRRQKNKPESMKRGKKFHDPPMTTRRTGQSIDSFDSEREIER